MHLLAFLALLPMDVFAARIVSTSPQITELLFQLGRGQEIVGTVEYSDYPAEAKKIPRIGPLFFPGVEATIALAPTVVFIDENAISPVYTGALKRFGIPTVGFNVKKVEHLADFCRKPEVSGKSCVPPLNRNSVPPFRYVVLVWVDPIVGLGGQTFLSDVLERLGGENLLKSYGTDPFPLISEEWLVSHRPDHIYFLRMGAETDGAFRKRVSQWWKDTPPIHFLESDHFARASQTPFLHLKELEP